VWIAVSRLEAYDWVVTSPGLRAPMYPYVAPHTAWTEAVQSQHVILCKMLIPETAGYAITEERRLWPDRKLGC
jgi:hypothetical protein